MQTEVFVSSDVSLRDEEVQADMARAMLGKADFFDRLSKHGPLRPYLFGNDVRVPGDDEKSTAGETAAQSRRKAAGAAGPGYGGKK